MKEREISKISVAERGEDVKRLGRKSKAITKRTYQGR